MAAMARPREFDVRKALDQALTVFWTKGFDGASISDLTEATGLGRASLYAAFGDKEGLFRAAVQHYLERLAAKLPLPSAAPSGASWLRTFFLGIASMRKSNEAPRGCFLQAAASQCDRHRRETHELLTNALAQTEGLIHAAVVRAQLEGDIASDRNIDEVVSFLLVLLYGINASARIGRDAEQLRTAALVGLAAAGLRGPNPTDTRPDMLSGPTTT